jgi:uncharacterized protein (TIGR03118 family)
MMKKYFGLAAAPMLAMAFGTLAHAQNYTQVNLVANKPGVAPVTDPNLVNPWGLSRGSGSPWWVSDTGTGLSTLYNGAGVVTPLVVTIPKNPAGTSKIGSPTGVVYNGNTADFLLGVGFPASFLFSTIDGTIAGWNSKIGIPKGGKAPSTNAVTVAKGVKGSVYTGLTAATWGGKTYLYAANIGTGKVDVFNSTFHAFNLPPVPNGDQFNPGLEEAFFDALLPAGFAPYNVQAVGNDIVVTYASASFKSGPGLGYVDVYSAAGELLNRLQWGPWFNGPWGVALAPTDFGTYSHALLIGNFGGGGTSENAGTIAAFDLATGDYLGQVETAAGKPVVIEGLWALAAGNGSEAGSFDPAGAPAAEIYFTAGPNKEQDGLFGYLKPVATELTDGNDQ